MRKIVTLFLIPFYSLTFPQQTRQVTHSSPFICITNWSTGQFHLRWRYLFIWLEIYRSIAIFNLFRVFRLKKPLVISISVVVSIIFPFAQNQNRVRQCWNRCLLWQCIVVGLFKLQSLWSKPRVAFDCAFEMHEIQKAFYIRRLRRYLDGLIEYFRRQNFRFV